MEKEEHIIAQPPPKHQPPHWGCQPCSISLYGLSQELQMALSGQFSSPYVVIGTVASSEMLVRFGQIGPASTEVVSSKDTGRCTTFEEVWHGDKVQVHMYISAYT